MNQDESRLRETFLYSKKNSKFKDGMDGVACFSKNGKVVKSACSSYSVSCQFCTNMDKNAGCRLTHSIEELFSKNNEQTVDSKVIYITTNCLCYYCAKLIVKNGIRKVIYYSNDEVDVDVSEFMVSSGVNLKRIDIDRLLSNKDEYSWTDELYNYSYDSIPDECKIPIVIQSYNYKKCMTLNRLRLRSMNNDYNWPVFVVVRDSQFDDYDELWGDCEYVNIISFDDELINNSGATRRQVQKYFYNEFGYDKIITIDDDMNSIGYFVKVFSFFYKGKVMSDIAKCDPLNVIAMFQIMSEKVMDSPGRKVAITCGRHVSSSRSIEFSDPKKSARFSVGPMSGFVLLNLKLLEENNIYYRDSSESGHDDQDLLVQIINSGLEYASFPIINYSFRPIGEGAYKVDEDDIDVVDRFKKTQDIIKRNYPDLYWISYYDTGKLPQVKFSENGIKEYQVNHGVYPENSDFDIDIWEDGDLIKQARFRRYSEIEKLKFMNY